MGKIGKIHRSKMMTFGTYRPNLMRCLTIRNRSFSNKYFFLLEIKIELLGKALVCSKDQ